MFKLKSFIPEIKILPNSLIRNNEELANYLNKNKKSFLSYIKDDSSIDMDYLEETILELTNQEFEYNIDDDIVSIFNYEDEDFPTGFFISLNPISEDIHGEDAEQIEVEYKGLKLYLHF